MTDASITDASSAAEQRLLELLADRAVFGLEPAEEQELAALLAAHPNRDPDALDRLAAAVAINAATAAPSPPHSLKTQLREDAVRFAQRRSDPVIEPAGRRTGGPAPARSSAHSSALGMMVAGLLCALATLACVVVASRRDPAGGVPPRRPDRPTTAAIPTPAAPAEAAAPRMTRPVPTPAMLRDEMLAAVGDALRLDCAAAVAADDAKTSGDVVWSGSRQRGFLRISGLAANEPTESQYQIWIVEGGRGRPVPGGVFDVGREAWEVIVPILPRVFVQGPTTFVVTVEKPGGAEDYSEERSRVLARAR
jgi:hypothetical protein